VETTARKRKLRGKLAVGGVLATVVALCTLGSAAAAVRDNGTSTQQVPTQAQVKGAGIISNIECSWALPDLNLSGGLEENNTDTPNPTPPTTFRYGYDDDRLTLPNPVPCDLGGDGTTKPQQADGQHHLIQVLPNAEDQPAERRIELWAAADNPAGIDNITDVYWKVFHPDGTLKKQIHGVRIDQGSKNPDCHGPDSMFWAAEANGELTTRAVTDPTNGMIALCQEGVKALFHNTFLVSKDQPNGEYKIETHVVSTGGLEQVQTFYIDILPFYNMVLDFNKVDYGLIVPGVPKTINGDTLFGTAPPTVKNTGNSAMGLGLLFSNLVQQTDQNGNPVLGGKLITQFDASFGTSAAGLQHIALINAGVPVQFDDAPTRQLCPNDTGKIDFSVEPPGTLPAGTYAGTVQVVAHSPDPSYCPTDHGSIYDPKNPTRWTPPAP